MTWNVLTIEPRRENKAAKHLSASGVEPYNPTFQRHVRAAPTCSMPYRKVDWPIFDGYLFVRSAEVEQNWQVIRNAVGVRGWLSTVSGTPAVLSDEAIDRIRQVEKNYRQRALKRGKHALTVGMRVRISRHNDAFDGMEGTIKRLDSRDKAVVHLMMPGRNVWPIRVSARWLREAAVEMVSQGRVAKNSSRSLALRSRLPGSP